MVTHTHTSHESRFDSCDLLSHSINTDHMEFLFVAGIVLESVEPGFCCIPIVCISEGQGA